MTFTSYESTMTMMINFRPAVASDSDDLLDWRNDPDSRRASISQDPVDRQTHEPWFTNSLSSPDRWICIAVDEPSGEKVGMCRFDSDRSHSEVEVSINLNPVWRGRGIATNVLTGALDWFRAVNATDVPLTATIRSTNVASARIFRNAGFDQISADDGVDYYSRPTA
jgi:RimJ/RimL family protein N-acetyltransferase